MTQHSQPLNTRVQSLIDHWSGLNSASELLQIDFVSIFSCTLSHLECRGEALSTPGGKDISGALQNTM